MEQMTKEPMKIKVLPNSFEAEQSLLGAILIDGILAVSLARESDDIFYNARNRTIFKAVKELVKADKNVDLITVNDHLERAGLSDGNTLSYLTELASMVPSSANADEYHDILVRDYTLRNLIQNCNKIIEQAYHSNDAEKVVRFAEEQLFNVSREYQSGDLKHISAATSELLKHIEKMMKTKGAETGLRTRMKRLDFLLEGGLHKSDLIIIAARPSVGKTTIALNFLVNIARAEQGKLMAVFSLEMASIQLAQRLLANAGNVPMSDINKGNFSGATGMEQLWTASKEFDNSEIYFDETSMTSIEDIISKCRRLSIERKKPLDLVIIDYLQLMEGDKNAKSAESRNIVISNISRKLKVLAKDMNCPVIAISQMSRSVESRDEKEPMLSDLRESGAIEQDADIVMFLYREDENLEKGESPLVLEIAKHRNGQLGKVRLAFEGQYNRFTESESQENIRLVPKVKVKKTAF